MKFSLVIPCYNEAANLPLLLDRCKEVTIRPDIEIILVDNGSTDNSPEVLLNLLPQYPGCRSVRVEINQGYGSAFSRAQAAPGEIIGWTHADMQTDPPERIARVGAVRQARIGHVRERAAATAGPWPISCSRSACRCSKPWLLGERMWDINAQPTLFPRAFFETWREAPYDFSLDLYAYYQARCNAPRVHRLPVRFGERAHGVSHWNVNWAAKRKFIRRTVDFSLQLRKSLKT